MLSANIYSGRQGEAEWAPSLKEYAALNEDKSSL